RAMLPHIPDGHYPGWSLNNALYLAGGVRGVEVGSVMFGKHPDGSETPAPLDLVRLAFPRRVYTQSHVDYLAEIIAGIYAQRERVPGHRIVWQAPVLRHFTVRLEPVEG
ncbi:MAG: tyrosine phenol-lyase, partial [Anaerolineae bacterium]|nr:tyrosine phenol-lyase [Anaerolineae bacterium]